MGVTEKKKNKGFYLLLHRSGIATKVKASTAKNHTLDGIMAIINLDTLEQYNGETWEKVPEGYDIIIDAENQLLDEEYEDEETSVEDNLISSPIQNGARRLVNLNVLWAYTKGKISS